MNADSLYRLFSTLANTACFGYVLTVKIVDHQSYLMPVVAKSVGISTTILCTAVYFALFYISVLDRRRKERPRLGPHIQAIRECVISVRRIDVDQVNVKAKTNEGLESVGRGEAIATQAIALIHCT